jgi:hypothetical protein
VLLFAIFQLQVLRCSKRYAVSTADAQGGSSTTGSSRGYSHAKQGTSKQLLREQQHQKQQR